MIFISYRRADAPALVGRIADRLRAIYGDEAISLDIDSFRYGKDFRTEISEHLATARVVLVIVGPKWMGTDRSDLQSDWVRAELETALSLKKLIIPILVEGQAPLTTAELPESLHPFAYINAVSIQTGALFNGQFNVLANAIENALHRDPGVCEKRANPNVIAANALLDLRPSADETPYVRHIDDIDELRVLWEIDNSAYNEASISFDTFVRWHETYEPGLKVLFHGSKIIGAFGIWPITKHEVQRLRMDQLDENELEIVGFRAVAASPSTAWYVSGIVLTESMRGTAHRNPLPMLLNQGMNLWLQSGHVEFPCELFAISYSPEGARLTERFGFVRLRPRASAKEPYPLYWIRFRSRAELVTVLRKRGLHV